MTEREETRKQPGDLEGMIHAAESVRGTARVCGILANPVEHSMSPMLQNLYAESTGTDLVYVPFKVKEEELQAAVSGAFALNILGMNVTVPHKQAVMKYLDDIDEAAREVGAVNTLVRTERGYKGYNTDVEGLRRAVEEAGFAVNGRDCLLIGAGGAARAAVCMMARGKAGSITVLNRSLEKAEELAEYGNRIAGRDLMKALPLSQWKELSGKRYLAIQCTSVGMHPAVDAAPVEDREFYQLIEEALDVIYTPAETKFMHLVREAGGRAVNGLKMLVYQGAASYELWNPGTKIEKETLALAEALIQKRLQPKRKTLVLIGFMGAGKTSVGKELAELLGCALCDTDQETERQAGMAVSEIFRLQGEENFRKMETDTLRKLLKQTDGDGGFTVISAGGGLVLREENQRLLKENAVCVYLKASPGQILHRLQGDTSRPLLQGGNVREKVEGLMAARGPVYEKAADITVNTDGRTPGEIAREIAAFAKSS